MGFRIGVDVGGTFTDFILLDDQGNVDVHKVLTTPRNLAEGVFQGIKILAKSKGLSVREFLARVDLVIHGTTVTTNALLTGTGAKTGFITTKGFRDVLNMRRGLKEDQYETKYGPPAPLVPRRLICAVEERVDCEGQVIVPLKEDDVYTAAQKFRDEGVESVGVSLLFSFFEPSHERKVRDILKSELPEVYISLSSEILPQIRLYERNSTVALNAYVGPILQNYLSGLIEKLSKEGFTGSLLVMQSNGGVMSSDMAMRFAANTLLSGPAGGPAAGSFYATPLGVRNLITIDMGGTSFDACLVRNGVPGVTNEAYIARHRFALPMIDINTIGAGGGSIAWIDVGGILKVGPQSAGADPGPACYGFGGEKPTVTDADLVLGYLNPDYFFGGALKLDQNAAYKAIEAEVAKPLNMDVLQAAEGIFKVVNANMAASLRVISIGKGYDPREFMLIVAGGAGPIHAASIAEELEIPLILVPKVSSVFCAAGMLVSDLRHDYVRTYACPMSKVDLEKLNRLMNEMKFEARSTLQKERVPESRMVLRYSADLRYEGQFNEVEVPFESLDDRAVENIDLAKLQEAFHIRHDALYGYSLPDASIELLNVRLTALGKVDKPSLKEGARRGRSPEKAFKMWRRAVFDGELLEVPVYDGVKMGNGMTVSGPAIIEEPNTTLVVTPKYQLICDLYDNYLLFPKNRDLSDVISELRGVQ